MNSKIRVMHVNVPFGIGGVEQVLLSTAKFNWNDKYELVFVTNCINDVFISNQIKEMGHTFLELNITDRMYDLRIIPKLVKIFTTYKPQIVHLYGKASIFGRISAKCANIPIIICNEVEIYSKDYSVGLKIEKILKRKLDFLADSVVSCSEAVRKDWIKNPSKKYQVIFEPFDLSIFPRISNSSNKNLFKNGKYPILGTVSRIVPIKGHEYLIRAMPKIIDIFPLVQLRIVGSGFLLTKMKKLADSLNLENNIQFVGFAKDLYKELSSMDIYVLPSLSDGFPISILEAMAAELPIAASNVGGIPEMVINGETGLLFPSKDSDAIVESIIKILSDMPKARQMGKKGKERVVTHFSPEIYMKKLDVLYTELLSKKGVG